MSGSGGKIWCHRKTSNVKIPKKHLNYFTFLFEDGYWPFLCVNQQFR